MKKKKKGRNQPLKHVKTMKTLVMLNLWKTLLVLSAVSSLFNETQGSPGTACSDFPAAAGSQKVTWDCTSSHSGSTRPACSPWVIRASSLALHQPSGLLLPRRNARNPGQFAALALLRIVNSFYHANNVLFFLVFFFFPCPFFLKCSLKSEE